MQPLRACVKKYDTWQRASTARESVVGTRGKERRKTIPKFRK